MTCLAIGYIYFAILWCIVSASVQVEVEQGYLRGEIKTASTKLVKYYSFKGIPFATPPLGKLRFKAPQPARKWDGIRNAIEHGNICMQPTSFTNYTPIGNEDCLFLNVYSPNIKPNKLLPVLFFIHGGIFIGGSGNSDQFSPDFLMCYDVVLVTVNYRLGAFGFMAVDTEQVPGNAGMKDNVAALQWVQKNINSFGGDPDYVTLVGESSGAAMVSLHVVAPSTKNLFKRAIMMSGTFFNERSITFEPKRRAFALGRVLGLDTNDPNELTDFLQSVPPGEIIQAHPNFITSDEIAIPELLLAPYFTPNIEKKFGNGTGQYLTTRATELMCKHQINQVDIMIGHTESEGLSYVADSEDVILKYFPKYKELLVPLKIRLFRSPTEVLRLADKVSSFYFKNQPISRKTVLDFIEFATYFRFVFDIHGYTERLPKLPSVRRYFYEFAIYSSRNYYSENAVKKFGIKNATHGDDLPYLFDGSTYNFTLDINSNAFKDVQLTCELFTNFVKYGTPTPNDSLGLVWPEYDPNRAYVSIRSNRTLIPSTVPAFTGPNLKFWRELYLSTKIKIY